MATTEQHIRPGTLASIRRRIWRVDDIAGDILTATPIDDFAASKQRFLMPVEAVEPATVAPPSLECLGDHILQQLLLRAIRLDALHGTAPFVSLQRTGIVPVEYQLVPLIMSLRQDPVRLLLADSVGLGKTIEAGLIILELLARGRARNVLIVTPANLRDQWQQQLRDLFYVDFTIISTERRRQLERSMPPGADPWLYYDRVITSIDYAKDFRIRSEILKRRWDLVVVDEAHNAAMPHHFGRRNNEMERWEFIRDLALKQSKHLLLLTATPHNGYTDSFSSLLQMLSPSLVIGSDIHMRPDRAIAVHHVCQRTRQDIREWFVAGDESFPFPEREFGPQTEVGIKLDRDYRQVLDALDTTLEYLHQLVQDDKRREKITEWLGLHLHRRALSSPEALRISLANRIKSIESRKQATPDDLTQDDQQLLISLVDSGRTDVQSEDEIDRQADTAELRIDESIQLREFKKLLSRLQKVTPAKDKKLLKLRDEVLKNLMEQARGKVPSRVIVFTRFKDTLDYLQRHLADQDYAVHAMHGDLSQAQRDDQFREFIASPRAVLLATDVISEGLNLQSACCMMVHYDLPWNPNRLEQRVGRIDRFGQIADTIHVRTMFCEQTTDEDVMALLVRKLEKIRHDQGFCPPFFATEETVLRVLANRRKKKRADESTRSLFDEIGEEEALIDEAAAARAKSEGFYGQSDVRISDVSERLREAHETIGDPSAIRQFIRRGIERYGCRVDDLGDGMARVVVNNPRMRAPGVADVIEKAVFDPTIRLQRGDVEALDVGHPLVRRLGAVIREDAFRNSEDGGRTAAACIKGIDETVLLGHGFLRAIVNTEPPTLIEEVTTFGMTSGIDGRRILSPQECQDMLAKIEFGEHKRAVNRQRAVTLMNELANTEDWQHACDAAIEHTLESVRQHRAAMKQDLLASDHTDGKWLLGFDDVELVGFDLYCLTIPLPDRD